MAQVVLVAGIRESSASWRQTSAKNCSSRILPKISCYPWTRHDEEGKSGTSLGYRKRAVISGEVELVVSACRSIAENVKILREDDRWSRPADWTGGAYQIEVVRLGRETGRRGGRGVAVPLLTAIWTTIVEPALKVA